MVEKVAHSARPKAGIAMVENLGCFFGERRVGELTGALQRDFAKQRGSQSAARRELETLAAAINYHVKDMVGGVQTLFRPTLPDAPDPRQRWLTRSEAARLIWAAWRKREMRLAGAIAGATPRSTSPGSFWLLCTRERGRGRSAAPP